MSKMPVGGRSRRSHIYGRRWIDMREQRLEAALCAELAAWPMVLSIRRQVRLGDAGRADVIVEIQCGDRVLTQVIECKAQRTDMLAAVQCWRYVLAIREQSPALWVGMGLCAPAFYPEMFDVAASGWSLNPLETPFQLYLMQKVPA